MTVLLDESVQNYIDWLKNIKKAPYHTFRAYQVDLLHFLKYFLCLEKNDIPSKEEMEEYLASIKNKYNYASYRRKVTVLRNFTSHLVDSGIDVPDPFISISLPMPGIDFNIPVLYEEVLEFIENLPENESSEIRDKIIFSLVTKAGLTVKQVTALKVKDINMASNQIFLSRNQMTFIDPKTQALIEKYLSFQSSDSPLTLEDFIISRSLKAGEGRVPLSTRSINLIIDKTSVKLKFRSRLSPTILRRLFAKSLTDKNINKATKELIFGKKCRLVS